MTRMFRWTHGSRLRLFVESEQRRIKWTALGRDGWCLIFVKYAPEAEVAAIARRLGDRPLAEAPVRVVRKHRDTGSDHA